jgi:hypothetical protein
MKHRLVLGMVIGLALPCAASAQNPQPAPPQVVHPPVAPPGSSSSVPEKVAPADSMTLSDKLAQQQGTLKPPSVDPGITTQPPHVSGNMPVIPPPGTPGGNQDVQPK